MSDGWWPAPPLDTARLTLRPWTAADIADLLALDDDPEVVRFVGGPTPRDEREARWRAALTAPWTRPVLIVRERECGAFCGWAFLRPFRDGSGDWELGYRLVRAAWGRGVATEAAGALFDWGRAQPAIAVIGAVHEAGNLGSRRVLEKLGLADAGTRVHDTMGEHPYREWRRPPA